MTKVHGKPFLIEEIQAKIEGLLNSNERTEDRHG